MPLSDWAPLLAVVLLSQLAHESGHALAAAMEHVPAESLGILLVYPCIPIAYVLFSSRPTQVSHRGMLRITGAGIWHNALLLIAVWTLGAFPFLRWLRADAHGLRIQASHDPILASWLPHGQTIVTLGDVDLVHQTPAARLEMWDVLARGDAPVEDAWCVLPDAWANATSSCCLHRDEALACFVSDFGDRCFAPLDVFTAEAERCSAQSPCAIGVCMAPRRDERLSRLSLLAKDGGRDVVVLRGSLAAMASRVRVTPWRLPTFLRLLFGKLGEVWADALAFFWAAFVRYAYVVNGSLFLFNMLPIAPLDGAAYARYVLESVYAWYEDKAIVQPDDVEGQGDDDYAVERVLRVLHVITAALTAVALLGSCLVLLHSFLYSPNALPGP